MTTQDLNLSVMFMHNWDPLLSENASTSSPPQSPISLSYNTPTSSSTPNLSPCQWQVDLRDVQRVAAHVGIPEQDVKMVDLTKEYWTDVFEPALGVWEAGGTPNPDVSCNRWVSIWLVRSRLRNTWQTTELLRSAMLCPTDLHISIPRYQADHPREIKFGALLQHLPSPKHYLATGELSSSEVVSVY
jgi:hypothetical protein